MTCSCRRGGTVAGAGLQLDRLHHLLAAGVGAWQARFGHRVQESCSALLAGSRTGAQLAAPVAGLAAVREKGIKC